jgi:uncharacterized protein (TIGR03084 family)
VAQPGQDEVLIALRQQQDELAALIGALDEGQWARPSRCEGWTVSDVLLHLAHGDELAVGSLEGRLADAGAEAARGLRPARSVDDASDLMVARDRGQPGSAIRERWQASAEALSLGLSSCEPRRRVAWVAGELSARTLATTRLAETWIHTGDVAEGLDMELRPTNRLRLIARLAWRTLPYAFARASRQMTGPVAFELRGPAGDIWNFVPDSPPLTTIRGDALELCLVAGRRVDPGQTLLLGTGPDAEAVLELVRTYA